MWTHLKKKKIPKIKREVVRHPDYIWTLLGEKNKFKAKRSDWQQYCNYEVSTATVIF